jgi:hypothetical protein
MVSHLQFCSQVSKHSNNKNFLARFIGRMHFGVQIQTKPMTFYLVPFEGYKISAKTIEL